MKAVQTLINDVKHEYEDYFGSLTPQKQDYDKILDYMKPNMTTAARNTYEPKRYQSIPKRNTIRFRNTYNRFRVFSQYLQPVPSESAYAHRKASIYITDDDIEIAKSVYEISQHTVQFVDYFESENNYQVSL